MQYLDFEKPLEELNNKLIQAKELSDIENVDVSKTIRDIELQIQKTKEKIYKNLTSWQKVQLSRHPERPYTLDYINALTEGDFIELHGDRNTKDDKAMIGGWGTLDNQTVMFIGQQKGRNTKERQFRNFGMANPEGYRKALRIMKFAEKFNGKAHMLPSPGILDNKSGRNILLKDSYIKKIFELYEKLTIALVGIGQIKQSKLLTESGNCFNLKELEVLKKNQVVGDINLRFISKDGKNIKTDLDKRIMGIGLNQLKMIPRRIGVAGGKQKHKAIKASIIGDYINTLITDSQTANYLINSKLNL